MPAVKPNEARILSRVDSVGNPPPVDEYPGQISLFVRRPTRCVKEI
jgi:hypothetical protein